MKKLWADRAWDDYLYWQMQDKKTLKRINELIKCIEREGVSEGIGKPEPLKHRKAWSRRIDEVNRLVYNIDENGFLWIIACRGHYDDQYWIKMFFGLTEFDEKVILLRCFNRNRMTFLKMEENR